MSRHSCSDAQGLLRLFVYGTLKRGYWNHETYCGSAISVEQATVRGRLYELPSGIPVREVPDEDIAAAGTFSPSADLRTQNDTAMNQDSMPPRGDQVHGELISFDYTDLRLPQIDRLEGYSPSACALYRRVLIPVFLASGEMVSAWCYVAEPAWGYERMRVIGSRWPCE